MKLTNLIFLLSLTILSSCDSQVGTAVSTAFKNIFTGDMFANSASDDIYGKLKEQTLANPNQKEELLKNCDRDNYQPILPENDKNNFSSIKNELCTCQAWGTCDKNSCSCDILCPANFNILKMNNNVMEDSTENSLAFTNGDWDFYKKYSGYQGFCWGHAVVTQRFNRLASFKPNLPKSFTRIEDYDSRRNHYKNIIKALNNNEPVDIPGFKNLYEFSRNIEVKELLQDALKDEWASNAMSTQGLSIVSSSKPQGADHYNKLYDDIEFRLKNNQMPAIVFNQRDQATYAHTVLVNGAGKDENGMRYLCLRDNNFDSNSTRNCQQKMTLGQDGTITYDAWSPNTIGKVELSYTENKNTLEQIKNLKSKCSGEKSCLN